MARPAPSLIESYDRLHDAAAGLGFSREAARIAQRREGLNDPFLLYIMGRSGSGKSALINLLLGRRLAPTGVARPWLNVYRQALEGREHAVVYARNGADEPIVLSLEDAAVLNEGPEPAIERIVWYLNAPDLPRHLALVEIPEVALDDLTEDDLWQADGVIWTFRVDQLRDDRMERTIDRLHGRNRMRIQTMGAVTHMDAIPASRWSHVVKKARAHIATDLEHVVPCALPEQPEAAAPEGGATLLRREVKNRFFFSARSVHLRNQHRFAEVMQEVLTERFEAEVDRALENRWAFLQFRRAVEQRIDALKDELVGAIHRFVDALMTRTLALARRLEQAAETQTPWSEVELPPPVSIDGFFREVQRTAAERAQRVFTELAFDDQAAARLVPAALPLLSGEGDGAPRRAAVSFRLPEPPLDLLRPLAGDMDPGDRTEAWVYQPQDPDDPEDGPAHAEGASGTTGAGTLTIEKPAAAAVHWQTAETWIPPAADRARRELTAWLNGGMAGLKKSLETCAAANFEALHGYTPDQLPAALVPLEATYYRLHDQPVHVPAPHLSRKRLSPVQFLYWMQEESFIESWNQKLGGKSFEDVLPRVHGELHQEIHRLRKRLAKQWADHREAVYERAQEAWQEHGEKLLLQPRVKWSATWIGEVMQACLESPVEHFAAQPVRGRSLVAFKAGLFLGDEEEAFLLPLHKRTNHPPEPEEAIGAYLQRHLAEEARRFWERPEPLHVEVSLQRRIRRRTLLAGGLFTVFAMTWMMMFGFSGASLFAVIAIAVPYSLLLGWAIRRLMRASFKLLGAEQARTVFDELHTRLMAFLDHLQDELDRKVRDADFRTDIERTLHSRQAVPSARYLPYNELIRRLHAL